MSQIYSQCSTIDQLQQLLEPMDLSRRTKLTKLKSLLQALCRLVIDCPIHQVERWIVLLKGLCEHTLIIEWVLPISAQNRIFLLLKVLYEVQDHANQLSEQQVDEWLLEILLDLIMHSQFNPKSSLLPTQLMIKQALKKRIDDLSDAQMVEMVKGLMVQRNFIILEIRPATQPIISINPPVNSNQQNMHGNLSQEDILENFSKEDMAQDSRQRKIPATTSLQTQQLSPKQNPSSQGSKPNPRFHANPIAYKQEQQYSPQPDFFSEVSSQVKIYEGNSLQQIFASQSQQNSLSFSSSQQSFFNQFYKKELQKLDQRQQSRSSHSLKNHAATTIQFQNIPKPS